jgi:hypothetical protein
MAREVLGISCNDCGAFLTEQPVPGVFACRKCDLAFPVGEHGGKSIRHRSCNIAVPLKDVLQNPDA